MPPDKRKTPQNLIKCCPWPPLWPLYIQLPHQSDGSSTPGKAGWPLRCVWSEWPPAPSEWWLAPEGPPHISLREFWESLWTVQMLSQYRVWTLIMPPWMASTQEVCVFSKIKWAAPPGSSLLVLLFSQGWQGVRQVPVVPLQTGDLLDQDFLLMQLEVSTG